MVMKFSQNRVNKSELKSEKIMTVSFNFVIDGV